MAQIGEEIEVIEVVPEPLPNTVEVPEPVLPVPERERELVPA